MLRGRKDKKLTSKISEEGQLLQLAREDMVIKKQILERMDKSDKEFKNTIDSMNATLTNIGTSIQQSVGLLSQMLQPIQHGYMTSGNHYQEILNTSVHSQIE